MNKKKDPHGNYSKNKQLVSVRLDKTLVTEIEKACINYNNSGLDIKRTTYITEAIKEKIAREDS